jgi:arsenate reductase (thioredoxin)
MYNSVNILCENLVSEFDLISENRKSLLKKVSKYIQAKKDDGLEIRLVYICTHNSRRSHFGQVWAAVAAEFYVIENVKSFSGGTETTAFNINAINALKKEGFVVEKLYETNNPKYKVSFDESKHVECFSKLYDDKVNPTTNFAAIMTCSDAEENCPFIPNVELRVSTTYEDPKKFDNTSLQEEKYSERLKEIGREVLYVFSEIK